MKKLLIVAITIFCFATAYTQTRTETFTYAGKIGKAKVVLHFYIPDHFYNYDAGDYYYKKYKKTISFEGSELLSKEAKSQKLIEKYEGKETGYFIFESPEYFLVDVIGDKTMKGKWYAMDESKEMDVLLKLKKKN